ncbi:MAG: (2Fe-2S)-binding protein [Deltaproteobacteria bacterium]|nr:(2Fe-2S)-binding protein [Deltaproteobacteria bacterium]
MESVQLTIDGIEVEAEKGTKILTAALNAGIHIPNLCYLPEADLPFGGCRLCYVDVEGRGPVTACTLPVSQGMVVNTRTPDVERLRKTAFKLLIAYHDLDCRNCWKNKRCALQKTAAKVKVKLKTPEDFRDLPEEPVPLNKTNPYITCDPNRCILCGKCVCVCTLRNGEPFLDFVGRGHEARITMCSDIALLESTCADCAECVAVCPTAALEPQPALEAALAAAEAKWAG